MQPVDQGRVDLAGTMGEDLVAERSHDVRFDVVLSAIVGSDRRRELLYQTRLEHTVDVAIGDAQEQKIIALAALDRRAE